MTNNCRRAAFGFCLTIGLAVPGAVLAADTPTPPGVGELNLLSGRVLTGDAGVEVSRGAQDLIAVPQLHPQSEIHRVIVTEGTYICSHSGAGMRSHCYAR